MGSLKETGGAVAIVVAGVVAAAILIRWGVTNNIPVLKLAAI